MHTSAPKAPLRLLVLLALLLSATAACRAPGASETEPNQASSPAPSPLGALLAEYFQEYLERNPIAASAIGDTRYNDRLPNNLAPAFLAEERAFHERWRERVAALDRDALTPADRLSYDVFLYERAMAKEALDFPSELLPVDQFTNPGSFFAQLGSGESLHPFETEKDYRDFLARAEGFAALAEQAEVNMRAGAERGIVQPRVLMEKVLPQLAAHIVERAEDSLFYAPLLRLPEEMSAPARAALQAEYEAAILGTIVPAYRDLHAFIADEYLPRCRDSVGLSALPGGADWYAHLVRFHTTTDLTPDEVHAFGLAEVARIEDEMRGVLAEVAFEGGLADFFAHLSSDDRYYFTDPADLIAGYEELQVRINALLPALFDIFPKADYEVRPVPDFMAEASAGASYQSGTPDGSRPGVFYINTFNLRAQPKYGMETLSLHEASPGHHFQISIAQEIESLPAFRRFGGTTAYAEGWALYCESIGRELGLFSDPYQYYGRLSDEMLRAMRLVVDTGMHHLGWSRERAIEYMLAHSSLAETDVVAEVERYIAIPGQALAYKVGQRVISELRARTEASLGERFDVRAFHRAVLEDGALPMDVLRAKIARWIEDAGSR